MRIEPPMSVPRPIGETLAAIAADSPPDEPPTIFVTSHGLSTRPYSLLPDSKDMRNYGTLVLMKGMAPDSRIRAICSPSSLVNVFECLYTPSVDGKPARGKGIKIDSQ